MVHGYLTLDRLAYLYLVLVIVVYGLSVYFPVREAVATAFLHIVQNVGHTIVYVLGRVAVVLGKERIFRCMLLQIHLYRSIDYVSYKSKAYDYARAMYNAYITGAEYERE